MLTQIKELSEKLFTLLGLVEKSAKLKVAAVAVIATLTSSVFLFKSCSPDPVDPRLVPKEADQLIDDLRAVGESITPPNPDEIEAEVENEIRNAQDDSSMFMDEPSAPSPSQSD